MSLRDVNVETLDAWAEGGQELFGVWPEAVNTEWLEVGKALPDGGGGHQDGVLAQDPVLDDQGQGRQPRAEARQVGQLSGPASSHLEKEKSLSESLSLICVGLMLIYVTVFHTIRLL